MPAPSNATHLYRVGYWDGEKGKPPREFAPGTFAHRDYEDGYDAGWNEMYWDAVRENDRRNKVGNDESLIALMANDFSASALREIAEAAELRVQIIRRNGGARTMELRDASDNFAQLAAYCRRVINMKKGAE